MLNSAGAQACSWDEFWAYLTPELTEQQLRASHEHQQMFYYYNLVFVQAYRLLYPQSSNSSKTKQFRQATDIGDVHNYMETFIQGHDILILKSRFFNRER